MNLALSQFMSVFNVSLPAFLPDAFLSAPNTAVLIHDRPFLLSAPCTHDCPFAQETKKVFQDQRDANSNKFPFLFSTNTQTRQIRGYTNTCRGPSCRCWASHTPVMIVTDLVTRV